MAKIADQLKASGVPDSDRTPCEVWTRVMGYYRPVFAFNPGKQAEHDERLSFNEMDIVSSNE